MQVQARLEDTVILALTSIIIVTYNKLTYNRLCIESIRNYTSPNSYEIIVVDNHSTDGTLEWLQGQPDIRLVANSGNVGFPAACNQGIAIAKGDSILLLNNDTIVTPRWLANLQQCLFSAADIGAVGAISNSCSNFQEIPCEYSSVEEMIAFAKIINHSDPARWENKGRLVGYCMLIKREVIDKIGLLDEIFSPGNFEDDDYSLRIKNAGYRLLLCRDVFIHHFGSVSFGKDSIELNSLLSINREKFIKKWSIDPYSILHSDPIQDPALKQWFPFEHDVNYYKQVVANARMKFSSRLNQAEFAFLSGDYEKALSTIMRAADAAHHAHPGYFVSAKLESLLRQIAEKLVSQNVRPFTPLLPKQYGKRNILHVLSQGYFGGGHTKVLERWITLDTTSAHAIAVTLNSKTTPPYLAGITMQSGGWYYPLDTSNLTFCQRAKALRDMAGMWADLVILHIHPHDPIPPVAFGIVGGPPIVFVNHADQAFSIGMSVADQVIEHRAVGKAITRARRISPAGCSLPVPLGNPYALENKQTAKRNLGVCEDNIVCLTVAPPYKTVPCGSYNLGNLLKEISNRHTRLELFVIGPSAEDWADLRKESQGKIKAIGSQQDLTPYYSAADIYVDSLPLGSYNEALEAGALGIPVVGLATEIAPLSSDIAPNIHTHFTSQTDLLAVIDKLVNDEKFRQQQGACLQATVNNQHYTAWTEHLHRLYSLAPKQHTPLEIPAIQEQLPDTLDLVLAYFQQQAGLSRSSFG